MGQALYRKYRSKALSEIVGQDHITTTLAKAIAEGKLAHAYLFTGPRGTGKTSIARILAHQINDIPYTDESIHLDIIEIDAASNRRIDEIRELRDKIHIAPTSAKYKVYIIDEVHMLTKEAFNALLKTLEEPPAHVVFILATTELHKVPDTIVSRTQRFAFKPVPQERVVAHLRNIADSENIDIDDEALVLVADHGGGSFRDSISLLDQLRNSPDAPVTADTVRLVLGVPKTAATQALLDNIFAGQAAQVLDQLRELSEQGFAAPHIAQQLYDAAKARLLAQSGDTHQLLQLMQALLGVAGAPDTALKLELVALQASTTQPATNVLEAAPVSAAPQPKSISRPATAPLQSPQLPQAPLAAQSSPTITAPAEQAAAPADITQETPDKTEANTQPEMQTTVQPASEGPFDLQHWPAVLQEAKNHNNTLYGVLRMAHPSFVDNKLLLAFAFPFHQKRINDSKHKAFISDSIVKITGQTVALEVVVNKSLTAQPYEAGTVPIDDTPRPSTPPPDMAQTTPGSPATAAASAPNGPDLKSVMDVFGGGEVL